MLQIIGETLADAGEQQMVDTYIAERASRGLRAIGVSESSDGGHTWRLVGLLSLLDPPRPDSAATIQRAQELGVEVKTSEFFHILPVVPSMPDSAATIKHLQLGIEVRHYCD